MRNIITCRSPQLRSLLESLPQASAVREGAAPEVPAFARYGTSSENSLEVCERLKACLRTIPGKTDDHSPKICNFYPSEMGVSIVHSSEATISSMSLDLFAPYLPIFDAQGLYHLIDRSLVNRGLGTYPFGLNDQERLFLDQEAIPAAVDAKIREAKEEKSDFIRFCIKVFGIGRNGSEFGEIVEGLLNYLETRPDFSGVIGIECIGFDLDLFTLIDSRFDATTYLKGVVSRSALQDRVGVTYDYYYGDLTEETILPAMLFFGSPDITLWRNTHILFYRKATLDYGQRMIEGMRLYSSKPGILLIHEGTPDGSRDLIFQEIVPA